MKVMSTSDFHGQLPDPESLECDLLLIAGDVCPDAFGKVEKYGLPDNGASWQLDWLDKEFRGWLRRVPARKIVGIAGNHDFVFEKMHVAVASLLLPWTYLLDQTIEFEGLKIHGTPWVPGLPRWAFHGRAEALELRAAGIEDDVDILVSHGPPWGTADFVAPQFGSCHVGDAALDAHLARIKPEVLVCGHIHEQYGRHAHKEVPGGVLNVCWVNEYYEPGQAPMEVNI